MKEFKTFLETSTIHGLGYLPQTNGFIRLFWIFIVGTGFSGAFYLINMSFENWDESPVTTNIETLPIYELKLPNVTVCPPKNSYTNLNMDIIESEDLTINRETIGELKEYANEVIQEAFYNELMSNLSKVKDPNRFSNWYYGHTEISFPYHDPGSETGHLNYTIATSAASGNISAEIPDRSMKVRIEIKVPDDIYKEKQANLILNLEKISVKISSELTFDEDKTEIFKNLSISMQRSSFSLTIQKMVHTNQQDEGKTPMFKLSWYYDKQSTISSQEPQRYQKQFVR